MLRPMTSLNRPIRVSPMRSDKLRMNLQKFVRPAVPRNVWLSRIVGVVTLSDSRGLEGLKPQGINLYLPPLPPRRPGVAVGNDPLRWWEPRFLSPVGFPSV